MMALPSSSVFFGMQLCVAANNTLEARALGGIAIPGGGQVRRYKSGMNKRESNITAAEVCFLGELLGAPCTREAIQSMGLAPKRLERCLVGSTVTRNGPLSVNSSRASPEA